MNVAQKNKLMEDKVKAVHDSTIKSEFTRLKAKHAKKMKKLDDDTNPKATPPKSRALPNVPKKKAASTCICAVLQISYTSSKLGC